MASQCCWQDGGAGDVDGGAGEDPGYNMMTGKKQCRCLMLRKVS